MPIGYLFIDYYRLLCGHQYAPGAIGRRMPRRRLRRKPILLPRRDGSKTLSARLAQLRAELSIRFQKARQPSADGTRPRPSL